VAALTVVRNITVYIYYHTQRHNVQCYFSAMLAASRAGRGHGTSFTSGLLRTALPRGESRGSAHARKVTQAELWAFFLINTRSGAGCVGCNQHVKSCYESCHDGAFLLCCYQEGLAVLVGPPTRDC